MTKTLQDKIDALYYNSDDDGETGFGIQIKNTIDKAIQELRESINNYNAPIIVIDTGSHEEYVSFDRSLIPVKDVLALIGEKK